MIIAFPRTISTNLTDTTDLMCFLHVLYESLDPDLSAENQRLLSLELSLQHLLVLFDVLFPIIEFVLTVLLKLMS